MARSKLSIKHAVLRCLSLLVGALLSACPLLAADAQGASAGLNRSAGPATPYPILFVTQVPLRTDVAARLSAFGNHLGGPRRPRVAAT